MPASNNKDNYIQQFKGGDHRGLEGLFKKYYAILCVDAENYIGDNAQAEEIVADAFTKIWDLRERFNTEMEIKGWLYITVRNACRNYLKKIKRQGKQDDNFPEMADNEMPEQRESIRALMLEDVYKAVEDLPNKCQIIFKLIFLDGLDGKEIANRLNISEDTVRSQKRRAIDLLRKALGNNWADDNIK